MNKRQYDRWKSFATRLAKHSFPNMTDQRRNRLVVEVERFIERYDRDYRDVRDWDGNEGSVYLCDDIDSWLYDRRFLVYKYNPKNGDEWQARNRFASAISCCVRAGFDVAVSPSAGVMGFDLGDLRRMWNGRIPKWVRAFFADPDELDSLPDATPVWL